MKALAAVFVLASLLITQRALADRDRAATLYKEGSAAFEKGQFTQAAAAFDGAYAEDPRGASAYNAALSWQNAHEAARAADDFAAALRAGDLGADLQADAKKQLTQLEAQLGQISIAGPAGSTFAVAHAKGSPPGMVHVTPGRWVVHASYQDGKSGDYPVDVAASATASVDVTPHVAPPVEQQQPVQEKTTPGGVFGAATIPVGISFVGVGVVATGFYIALGVATLDALSEFQQSGYHSQDAHDRAASLRTWTNVTFAAAVVMGGAGIATLVTSHRVKVQAAIGLGSLSLRGTF